MPFISLLCLFPLIIAPLTLLIFNQFSILPLWFQASSEMAFATSVMALTFLYIFGNFESKSSFRYFGLKSNWVFVFCLALVFTLLNVVNFREIFQLYGLNNLYSFLTIFSLIAIKVKLRPRFFQYLILFCIGFFLGSSGSKASLLLLVLYYFFVLERFSIKKVIAISSLIIGISLINPIIIIRYIDPGLSMINFISICEQVDFTSVELYGDVIKSYFTGGDVYNPMVSFYNNAGISAGYNVTPTIIGDLSCTSERISYFFGIFLFSFLLVASIKFYQLVFGINSIFFKVHLLFLLQVFLSTLMDFLKYEALFLVAAILYILIFVQLRSKRETI